MRIGQKFIVRWKQISPERLFDE